MMLDSYFQLGVDHITDVEGFDHIAFLITLLAAYNYTKWKDVLILVTAFTIGHNITLALAVLNIIPVNSDIIEFLIPVTIFFTALYHLFSQENTKQNKLVLYLMALGFGLIHGAGFSNFLKSMLSERMEVVGPLFRFNIGVEVGQLLIVVIILLIGFVLKYFGKDDKTWKHLCVGFGLFISMLLMMQTWPF